MFELPCDVDGTRTFVIDAFHLSEARVGRSDSCLRVFLAFADKENDLVAETMPVNVALSRFG